MRYVKVYKSLREGSLAAVGGPAYYLWPVFLLECDMAGHVDVHPGVLSRRWGVPEATIREALATWAAPDPDSKTPGEDGRRVVLLDPARSWGWRVVNFEKYLIDDGYERVQQATRKRVQRLRARRKALRDAGVTLGNATSATGMRDKGQGIPPTDSSEQSSSTVSAELRLTPPSAPPAPPVVELELVDGTAWPVSREKVDLWGKAFPAVNVKEELLRLRAWLLANPTRRKTRKGIERAIVAWLGRVQDKPKGQPVGVRPGLTPAPQRKPPTEAEIAAARAAAMADNARAMERLSRGQRGAGPVALADILPSTGKPPG